MAQEIREAPPRGSLEFVESSVLSLTIPQDTEVNIEEALSTSNARLDTQNGSPLSSIEQRQFLLFGKHISLGSNFGF